MSNFWIIVPVKDTRHSKQRLAESLTPDERQTLAHAMLEDVLDAIAPLTQDVRCALVTIDDFARPQAERHDFRVIEAGAHDGHTGAVDGARRVLAAEGAAGILTLPGDIPLVTTGEIASVLAAHAQAPAFTIVPAEDELGSNAIACSPPLAVDLRFGDNSYYPHLDAARRAGIEPTIKRCPGIGVDIDVPADLQRLLERDVESRTRTAQYLRRLAHSGVPA